MADHADWMGVMDQDIVPTSPGVDTAGHGDWFNAMDQDSTFGDVPQAPMRNVPKPTDYQNPTVDPDRWSVLTSLGRGGSLGLADPWIAETLAQREASAMRAAGADDATIAYMMPQWRAMAKEGLAHAQAEYHKIAPGMDVGAEALGSTITTAPAVGLLTGALAKGLTAAGLPAAARFIAGTAGRGAGGAPGVALASRAARGLHEGASTGVIQSQLNPGRPVGEQAKTGAALGTLIDAAAPAFHALGREVGGIDQAGAQAARRQIDRQLENIASREGVHSLVRDPQTGQASSLLLDMVLPDRSPWRRQLDDITTRERGLTTLEHSLAHAPPRMGHHLANRLGIGLGAGVGVGLSEPIIEILKNPSSWPYIMAGVAGTAGAVGLRNALIRNSAYRNVLLRAQAAGLTPAEYLGIGNPGTAAVNRLMEYTTPKEATQ